MARSEQEMIDDLFSRLKEAEAQTGERDVQAQQRIDAHISEQPGAPYYMAQTILIQEAAIKRLNARVEALEKQKSEKRSSGGFLAGIFGADQRDERPAERGRTSGSSGAPASGSGQNWQTNGPTSNVPGNAMRGGSGFLGGALQTAAGVAGGVMLGNMLMGMFGHHNSEEIVDVIEDPAGTDHGESMDTQAPGDGGDSQGGFEQADYSPQEDTGGFDQGGFDDSDSFYGGDDGGFDDFDEI